MGQLGQLYENFVLDAILGPGFVLRPVVYVGLFTSTPTSGGGGVEVSGGNYSRVSVMNNSTNWPPASSSQKHNGVTIIFPTASSSWGSINSFGLYEIPSGGAPICFGNLTTPMTIGVGVAAEFGVGTMVITAT